MNTLQTVFRRHAAWERLALAALSLTLLFTSPGLSPQAVAAGWEPEEGEAGFKVVSFGKQHFGDDAGARFGEQQNFTGVFVGNDFTYPDFNLPDIDTTKGAVIMMRTIHVNHYCNLLDVNNKPIVNGPIAAHLENLTNWMTQMVEIPSGHLKATGNKLRIRSVASDCALSGNLDDFLVDSVVVIYSRL